MKITTEDRRRSQKRENRIFDIVPEAKMTFVDKALRDTILGHSLQGMDTYYLKPGDEDLKAAIDKYTTWMDTQIASGPQNGPQEAKRANPSELTP